MQLWEGRVIFDPLAAGSPVEGVDGELVRAWALDPVGAAAAGRPAMASEFTIEETAELGAGGYGKVVQAVHNGERVAA